MINSPCQAWSFLSGFITYPVSHADKLLQENYEPVLRLVQKYRGNYALLNKHAYRASLHRDSNNKIGGEYHPEDFDFCYDNITQANCIMISFSNYNNFQKINNYGRKLINAACIDTFSVDESAW
jgi:hypothetical protein